MFQTDGEKGLVGWLVSLYNRVGQNGRVRYVVIEACHWVSITNVSITAARIGIGPTAWEYFVDGISHI